MQIFSKNKTAIEIVGIFILLIFGYNLFSSGSAPTSSTASSTSIGTDLVQLSNDLSKATLSTQIFSNPGYNYLIDFTTPIPQGQVGRANPFDPIGRE